MKPLKTLAEKKPFLTGAALWLLAATLTVSCFAFQKRTGPTQPLEGSVEVSGKPVDFRFMRSETIGKDLAVMLLDPVPESVSGFVKYRRFMSHDEWAEIPLGPLTLAGSRSGDREHRFGLGALLPGLRERAGKYEYFVFVKPLGEEAFSVTGDEPVTARFKGAVPAPVLIAHILVIFLSMIFAVRTGLEAAIGGRFAWMVWATIASLLAGAFVLGPIVQYYAFGVFWSGFPYGYDWTDNKVLVAIAFWLPALLMNLRGRRNRIPVFLAVAVTLAVYFIPHSLFGSQFDYRTGAGHGTADKLAVHKD